MASPQRGSDGSWSHDPSVSRLVGAVGRRWWALPTPTSERAGQGGADGEGQTPTSPEDGGRPRGPDEPPSGRAQGGRTACLLLRH